MSSVVVALLGFLGFFIGYRFYSRFVAEKIYLLDPDYVTPAHQFEDGVDYVPTNRHVLWGHHFTSVAGAAPIVGPAIAIYWGWLPAFLWVVLGTMFFAGVHDFGTLWVSVRHKAKSMGTLTNEIVGDRAKVLFLLIIFFLLLMVNAAFAIVITNLFVAFPGSVLPIWIEIPIAMLVGYLIYRRGGGLLVPSIGALVTLYVFVWIGTYLPIQMPEMVGFLTGKQVWIVLLFIYGFFASMLPVWLLLQPRDYINSHQLFVGLGVAYLGLFILQPNIVAPAINTALPADAPSFVPLLFITIACGAISGFHGLVSSGTSSKQLDKETDARFVGYFGAVGEGALALSAILAASAGFAAVAGMDAWNGVYASFASASGGAVGAYVQGIGYFATGIGIPLNVASVFAAVIVISFAATTLDTSIRLQRYIINELGEMYNIGVLRGTVSATVVAVVTSVLLTWTAGANPGGAGSLAIWPLFGTTNQLTAGLSLLVISLFLLKLARPVWYTLLPMIFLLFMTSWGMVENLRIYFNSANWLLFSIGAVILVLEVWLILEAISAFNRVRTQPQMAQAD